MCQANSKTNITPQWESYKSSNLYYSTSILCALFLTTIVRTISNYNVSCVYANFIFLFISRCMIYFTCDISFWILWNFCAHFPEIISYTSFFLPKDLWKQYTYIYYELFTAVIRNENRYLHPRSSGNHKHWFIHASVKFISLSKVHRIYHVIALIYES